MWRIVIIIFLISFQAKAQFKNIILDEADSLTYPPSEPSIAINPENPKNIVAAAILDKVYVTLDSGKTWTKSQITSPYGVFGDPVVVADRKGNFYYFHLSDPAGTNWQSEEVLDRIVCQKSEDGGITWNEGTFMGHNPPKDQDKEWAVTDKKGNIYVTWTQFDKYGSKDPEHKSNILFSVSTNGGKKWSDPVQINAESGNCIDDDNTVEGAMPAVLDDGKVFVTWAYNNKLYLDRSYDGGKMWLRNDLDLFEQPGGWNFNIPGLNRCNGFPVLVGDRSSTQLNGRIYLNWSDQSKGADDTDIWFSSSHNGGDSWAGKVRVNDDGPGNHQFLSWMAQDYYTGIIYIVYYDRRNYDDLRTDVYLAFSKDGGQSFKNVKISESPFIPDDEHFFGDYTNIAAHNGVIVPIWTRMDNGKTSIVTAVINQAELDHAANGQ